MNWRILVHVLRYCLKMEVYDSYYIAKRCPNLNDQIRSRKLSVFCNGVTWHINLRSSRNNLNLFLFKLACSLKISVLLPDDIPAVRGAQRFIITTFMIFGLN